MNPIGSAPKVAPGVDERARLRAAAHKFEGVLVEQLFKAMRETVPNDGLTSGGSGEEAFTGMLDQHLADATSAGSTRGPGEAVYRHLARAAGLAPEGQP